jgi:hypothetical protein
MDICLSLLWKDNIDRASQDCVIDDHTLRCNFINILMTKFVHTTNSLSGCVWSVQQNHTRSSLQIAGQIQISKLVLKLVYLMDHWI